MVPKLFLNISCQEAGPFSGQNELGWVQRAKFYYSRQMDPCRKTLGKQFSFSAVDDTHTNTYAKARCPFPLDSYPLMASRVSELVCNFSILKTISRNLSKFNQKSIFLLNRLYWIFLIINTFDLHNKLSAVALQL